MAKFCMQCGKENQDEAMFCIGCGQKFPDQPAPLSQTAQPLPTTYSAEVGTGAHKHMLSDIYLKDSNGTVVLVARQPSLIHADYNIVDGNEQVVGFIKSQTHLTHKSAVLEDANHNTQGRVNVSNVSQNRAPPSCWIEDAAGNRTGTITYIGGRMSFVLVRTDGSNIFQAVMQYGSGVRQAITDLDRRVYALTVPDSTFPLPMLLTVMTAIDKL